MSDYQQLAAQVQNLVVTNTNLVTEVARVRDATMGMLNLYPTIQSGLDNTPDGGYFSVPGLGQFLTLYRRNGSVHQTIAQYPTLASIEVVYDTKVDKVIGKQLSTEDFTTSLLNKLNAIELEATKNATDAELRDRATHTGAQAISTVTGLQGALDNKVDKVTGKQLSTEDYTTTEKSKLSGIAEGATTNSTDAQLRDRSTHTGTQAVSTITGLGDLATQDMDDIRGVYEVEPLISTTKPSLSLDFSDEEYKLIEEGIQTGMPLEDILTVTNGAATRVNHLGQVVPTAPNTPRIDWSSGKPQLLVEEQRTNLLTWSEDFSNGAWVKQTGDVTVEVDNMTTKPDGGLGAYIVNGATTTSISLGSAAFYMSNTAITGSGVFSVWLKKHPDGDDVISFRFRSQGDGSDVFFNSIPLTNEWVRYDINRNDIVSSARVYIGENSKFYIWGAQLEQASTPSSYIPTQASAVTRLADSVSRVLGEEFNPVEGSFLIEYDAASLGAGQYIFGLFTTGGNFVIRHKTNGDGNLNLLVTGDDFLGFNSNTTAALPILGKRKLIVSYKNGENYKVVVDGVVGQVTSTRNPALPPNFSTGEVMLEMLRIPNPASLGLCAFGKTKYYPKALSDQECIELTKV